MFRLRGARDKELAALNERVMIDIYHTKPLVQLYQFNYEACSTVSDTGNVSVGPYAVALFLGGGVNICVNRLRQ